MLHRLEKSHARMEALDPKKVLSRGYSIVSSANGIISTQHQFKSLSAGEMLQIVFHDGAGQVQKFGDNI